MKLKKILGWLLVAFLVFYVLSFPNDSANIIRSTVSALGDAAQNFAAFFKSIFV